MTGAFWLPLAFEGEAHLKFVSVNYEQVEGAVVARVTIDRRHKLNAMNSEMVTQLIETFDSLNGEPDLRAVVLDAAGEKAWIGGADVREMGAFVSSAAAAAFIGRLHAAMLSVRNLPVPVVAKIDGFWLGGGMELAAACDLRIASTAARFGMPEVRVGLPSVIEASLLPGLMGRGRAARLIYTGEVIDAAQAEAWGFVEEVVSRPDLDTAVERLIGSICKAGPRAIRAQKKLMRHWETVDPDTAAEDSIEVFGAAYESDEPAKLLGQVFSGHRED